MIVFRKEQLHGSKLSAHITLLNCFCENYDFFFNYFGFRQMYFRRENVGMLIRLRLGGINEALLIVFLNVSQKVFQAV